MRDSTGNTIGPKAGLAGKKKRVSFGAEGVV